MIRTTYWGTLGTCINVLDLYLLFASYDKAFCIILCLLVSAAAVHVSLLALVKNLFPFFSVPTQTLGSVTNLSSLWWWLLHCSLSSHMLSCCICIHSCRILIFSNPFSTSCVCLPSDYLYHVFICVFSEKSHCHSFITHAHTSISLIWAIFL